MAWTLDVILTVTMKDSEKVATMTTTIKPMLIMMDGILIMMATLMSDSELMLVTIDLEVVVKTKMVANKKAIMVTEVVMCHLNIQLTPTFSGTLQHFHLISVLFH